jgi:hypothetical protein
MLFERNEHQVFISHKKITEQQQTASDKPPTTITTCWCCRQKNASPPGAPLSSRGSISCFPFSCISFEQQVKSWPVASLKLQVESRSSLGRITSALSFSNNREELCGRRAEEIRTAISKKVCRWHLLDNEGKCVEKVLNRFKISSCATQQAQERSELKSTIKKERQHTNAKRKNLTSPLASSSSSGSSSDSSSSNSSSIGKKVAASAQKLPPVKDFPPPFIEAPTSKTTVIKQAKQSTPKPKNLSVESFPVPPVEANMNASAPRSPGTPLPRDTGEGFADCAHFFLFLHA